MSDKTGIILIMNKTKEAVNQQEQDNNLSVQAVKIGKNIAAFLIPDYNEGQKLVVIDEGVLKYLKSLLPTASTFDIINNFISSMKDILDDPYTLEAAVAEAKHFVAFHESVNLMKRYFDPKVKVTMETPFNVEKPEPTIDEKIAEWEKLEADITGTIGISISEYKYSKDREAMDEINKIKAESSGPKVVGKINLA